MPGWWSIPLTHLWSLSLAFFSSLENLPVSLIYIISHLCKAEHSSNHHTVSLAQASRRHSGKWNSDECFSAHVRQALILQQLCQLCIGNHCILLSIYRGVTSHSLGIAAFAALACLMITNRSGWWINGYSAFTWGNSDSTHKEPRFVRGKSMRKHTSVNLESISWRTTWQMQPDFWKLLSFCGYYGCFPVVFTTQGAQPYDCCSLCLW